MQKLFIYLTVICAGYGLFFRADSAVTLGPGVKAPADPVQRDLSSAKSIPLKGMTIVPLADYSITAKILSRKNYRSGRESEISPVDFALGRGNMSDESVIERLEVGQSGRWFNWRYSGEPPIPVSEIKRSCSNVHLIPANDHVEAILSRMKKGEVVSLRGKLIRAETSDGWKWESSLTRNDTGARACEVFYVEQGYTRIAR